MCYIWWTHVKVMKSNQEFVVVVENTKYLTHTHTHGERRECLKETASNVYPKGPKFNSRVDM